MLMTVLLLAGIVDGRGQGASAAAAVAPLAAQPPGAGYPSPGARPPADRMPATADGPAPPGADDRGFAAPPPSTGIAVRYDQVGYAVWSNDPGTIAAAHPSLPPGSFVEVTALDSGRTILVPITGVSAPGREIELSGAAATALGLTGAGNAAVRVRSVNPSGADLGALGSGRAPAARPDTPPILLNALRRKLAGTLGQPVSRPAPADTTPRYAPPSRPPATAPVATGRAARPAAGPGFYVQLAALSDPARAAALARSVGGTASAAGRVHRVRVGPFPDQRRAQGARDGLAARGYPDARIVREN